MSSRVHYIPVEPGRGGPLLYDDREMERQRIVIVGASLAGATAAATLRDEGFDGEIRLIGAETQLPYNRPPLSKGYLRQQERFEDQLEAFLLAEIALRQRRGGGGAPGGPERKRLDTRHPPTSGSGFF